MNDTEKKLALRKKSRSQMIWRQFRKSRTAILCLCILTVFVLFAVFADVIEDFDTRAIATNQQARFEAPSLKNPISFSLEVNVASVEYEIVALEYLLRSMSFAIKIKQP